MKYFPHIVCSLFQAVFLICFATGSVQAQHVPETEPRAGESRANQHRFFSSHNSYSGESITDLLDYRNVWEIELDVRWYQFFDDPGLFYVLHHCADPDGEGPLATYLDEIASTERIDRGFFFLNIELGDGYLCIGNQEFPSGYLDLLEDLIDQKIGLAKVYTWADFENDNKRWPSPQELIRRGKRVAIHMNHYRDDNGPFFWRWEPGTTTDPCAFWNTSNENENIPDQGDRYIIRRYPEAACWLEDNTDWAEAFVNGFNMVSTNCVEDRIGTHYQRMIPPIPMYVDQQGFGDERLGTWWRPHKGADGLFLAYWHILNYQNSQGSSGIPIVLEAGTYDITSLDFPIFGPPAGPKQFGGAYMTLEARDGAVTIR